MFGAKGENRNGQKSENPQYFGPFTNACAEIAGNSLVNQNLKFLRKCDEMIIIEGMDGGGKTHLAKQLSKELGLRVRHFGPPPKSYREFHSRCIQSTLMFGRRIIQDRCPFVSEVVYGSLREDVPTYNPWMKEHIAVKQLANEYLNPIIIHCRPIGHYLHHPENYDKDEYLAKIKKNWILLQTKYDMLMRNVSILNPVFTYDWTRHEVGEILGKIKERVDEKLKLIESLSHK